MPLIHTYSLYRNPSNVKIGLAVRIALAHGLHRRHATHARNPVTQNLSAHTLQNNIRIWWTTYIIERSLEFLMGRPSQIRDEDIDREIPSDQSGFPPATGLKAHAELAKIMGDIVSYVFRTRRRRKEDIDDVLRSLRRWKDRLAPSLRLGEDEFGSPSRSVLLLHLLYNQANTSPLRCMKLTVAHNRCLEDIHSGIHHLPIVRHIQYKPIRSPLISLPRPPFKSASSPTKSPIVPFPCPIISIYFPLIPLYFLSGNRSRRSIVPPQ